MYKLSDYKIAFDILEDFLYLTELADACIEKCDFKAAREYLLKIEDKEYQNRVLQLLFSIELLKRIYKVQQTYSHSVFKYNTVLRLSTNVSAVDLADAEKFTDELKRLKYRANILRNKVLRYQEDYKFFLKEK